MLRCSRSALFAGAAFCSLLFANAALLQAKDGEVPVNQGGVLLIHDHGLVPADTDSACGRLDLQDWSDARVEVPAGSEGEGMARLIGVYAAFAPGDSVLLAGLNFGIHYSSTVKVVGQGGCGDTAVEIASLGWPRDRTGVASLLVPHRTAKLIPIYWFLIQSNGPGWFEVTPHPSPQHGGMFGSGHPAPRLSGITGYGRLGIGSAGRLPEPGETMELGACCLETCYRLSAIDCAWYTGLWLGPPADCKESPCEPGGETGACCLGLECVLETRLDCALKGGRFLGQGTCDGVDCIEDVDVAPH